MNSAPIAADLERDHIKVDGKLIREPARHVYIARNKPDCVVSTASDPQRRTTVLDLLPGVRERVYPVGRLDYHSDGLILLTNDGEFANAITAAKSHVPKTYLVKVNGALTGDEEERFRTGGVPLEWLAAPLRLCDQNDPARGESLVRSQAIYRRTQPANPNHVQTFRTIGGKIGDAGTTSETWNWGHWKRQWLPLSSTAEEVTS